MLLFLRAMATELLKICQVRGSTLARGSGEAGSVWIPAGSREAGSLRRRIKVKYPRLGKNSGTTNEVPRRIKDDPKI